MSYNIDFNYKKRTVTIHLYESFGENQTRVIIQGGNSVSATEAEIFEIQKQLRKFLKGFDKAPVKKPV